jgi:hypothetical protein
MSWALGEGELSEASPAMAVRGPRYVVSSKLATEGVACTRPDARDMAWAGDDLDEGHGRADAPGVDHRGGACELRG